MKILVFGKTGQVAQELQRQANVTAIDRAGADLSDPAACAKIITQSDADIVINAAAYTNVDGAEKEADLANIINGDSPIAMATAAAQKQIPFIHISTDYVFDGSGQTPWRASDQPNPINVYGQSKLIAEQGIINAGGTFIILRTSWVFSAFGNNFVKTMLRLGQERPNLSIVNDQIGGPTPAADIAATLLKIAPLVAADAGKSGIYHYSGADFVSWADFASLIFAKSDIACAVSGILTKDYPTPAVRPKNSRLDCGSLQDVFGISPSNWQASLDAVLTELKDN